MTDLAEFLTFVISVCVILMGMIFVGGMVAPAETDSEKRRVMILSPMIFGAFIRWFGVAVPAAVYTITTYPDGVLPLVVVSVGIALVAHALRDVADVVDVDEDY